MKKVLLSLSITLTMLLSPAVSMAFPGGQTLEDPSKHWTYDLMDFGGWVLFASGFGDCQSSNPTNDCFVGNQEHIGFGTFFGSRSWDALFTMSRASSEDFFPDREVYWSINPGINGRIQLLLSSPF